MSFVPSFEYEIGLEPGFRPETADTAFDVLRTTDDPIETPVNIKVEPRGNVLGVWSLPKAAARLCDRQLKAVVQVLDSRAFPLANRVELPLYEGDSTTFSPPPPCRMFRRAKMPEVESLSATVTFEDSDGPVGPSVPIKYHFCRHAGVYLRFSESAAAPTPLVELPRAESLYPQFFQFQEAISGDLMPADELLNEGATIAAHKGDKVVEAELFPEQENFFSIPFPSTGIWTLNVHRPNKPLVTMRVLVNEVSTRHGWQLTFAAPLMQRTLKSHCPTNRPHPKKNYYLQVRASHS